MINLTVAFEPVVEEMWRGLVCWARKAPEGWIMGHSSGILEDSNADSGGSAHDVSERRGLSGTG